MNNRKLKSYLLHYSIVWGVFAIALFISKIILPYYFPEAIDKIRTQTSAIFFYGMIVFLLFVNFVEWTRFASYLEEKHGAGIPISNIGLGKFLKSTENYGDPFVDELKNNYRLVIAFSFMVLLTFPACMF